VGFQTPQGAANFRALVERCEVGEVDGDDLIVDGRRIEVRAFPIGVDAPKLQRMARDPAIRARAASLRDSLGHPAKVLLGVDRLDYTKGIARRLEAFGELLDDGRLKVPRHVMVQVAEPTRENVPGYSEFREQIDQIVGEINGKHGRFGHPAVNYIHRSQPIEELVALYLVADVMLVTPVRDGMNLVAKEYVACRTDNRGVLILSEFTGAASSMSSALMVNPYDIQGLKATIDRAIHIPDDDERRRMRELREGVIANDVHRWAADWLCALGVSVETEC
jgi:trehalose 6-phosphate synthase